MNSRCRSTVSDVDDQVARVERDARGDRMRFRQPPPRREREHQAADHHDREHRAPAEGHVRPAADDGRDGGREAEDHGGHAHEALRARAFVQIADHGAADHHADAGGHALQ